MNAISRSGRLDSWDELAMCAVVLFIERRFECDAFPRELLEVLNTWEELFEFARIKQGR